VISKLRRKNFHTWLGGYARHLGRRAAELRRGGGGVRHLLFAVCDHYEPLWGKGTPLDQGDRRVAAWEERYPSVVAPFRDADGLTPRHSFFFPGEEYDPRYLERLARLCAAGHGEVELHLHHDNDTATGLRRDIDDYLRLFAEHGHVSRDPGGGGFRFAFIHGNWCLANARQDGRWCGVDEEVQLLHEAGCYADFTFPSAPDECQPNRVNEIYWPTGDLRRRKAYATGEPARVGEVRRDRMLMITGPLGFDFRKDPGYPRARVRIENAALAEDDPPTARRVRTWVQQDIHVLGRPEWVFVKLHTHGAPERNAEVMLGDPMREVHQRLTRDYNDGRRWALHYVTAREMFNIAIAAMEGHTGDPGQYRDHVIPPPPVALRARAAA
jgi:hypothetical protein